MYIFPAIDIIGGKAVRLHKGNYDEMTVYSDDPAKVSLDFAACGAKYIHMVDLEGAKDSTTPNFDTVMKVKETSGLFCEIGGGIRSMEVIDRYLGNGIDRVILGTAAVNDRALLESAVGKYGARIAVGADIRDGYVAVKGWLETSEIYIDDFVSDMLSLGIDTMIVTDISKDGAMQGTNRALYEKLSSLSGMNITASGGVSSIDDVRYLSSLGLYGAIIGKAYYTGAIDLREAVEVASC